MERIFIPSKEGDFVNVGHIGLTNPDPHDPAVLDGAVVIAILNSGFRLHVKCGDLRAALGIKLPEKVAA
jgi:hypothetical protein